jgi:glycosyltransferase involved in cell wall biosynthesis
MISVLNITNRPGGIDILRANLARQTYHNFELVLVDGRWLQRELVVRGYLGNTPRLNYIRQSSKRKGALTNLAHADNEGFRACVGDLIVCLQDYIWIPPDGLEKFWMHYENNPNILVSGVGHQYGKPSKEDIKYPNGEITVFEHAYTKRPDQRIWSDPRMRLDQGSFYETAPVNWEMNWASIPKKVIYDLGGMDEQYDYEGFAWDNVNIAQRAEMMGYKTYLDQTNECMGFDHDGWWPNPLKVEKKSPDKYHHKVIREMAEGKKPIKLEYLN